MNKSFNSLGASQPETLELAADELGKVSGGSWVAFAIGGGVPASGFYMARNLYGSYLSVRPRCIP